MKLKEDINRVINKLQLKDKIKIVILFGSRARGDYNPKSDIDIAILLEEDVLDGNYLEVKIDLTSIFSDILGEDCDIVLINKASPLLKYQVIKHGRLIYIDEETDYNSFFSLVVREYFDFKFYLDFHNELMLKRIREGSENYG